MSKQKGTKAEREIVDFFWQTGTWAALRTPGSGSARFPSPDVIAKYKNRTLAIECKSTGKNSQYLRKDEIAQLREFSSRFHAEPWIAVKFARKGVYFLTLEDLEETPKFYVVTLALAAEKGVRFDELIKKEGRI